MTQFAMVEELAFLIKDNLRCKHLVLSMEEAFVNFLQDDSSPDGIMELEPMNPYNRLLLHRLADIFGFAHESVGEGDDRHLILERCPETSIPSILVSDILWQYDESESPTTSHQLLKRKEAAPVLKTKTPSFQYSLEEREAAYLAARERIFSMDEGEIRESVKQKPRNVPVVAQRMIAHALGQRIRPCNQVTLKDNGEHERITEESSFQEKDKVVTDLSAEVYRETICKTKHDLSGQNLNLLGKTKGSNPNSSASSHSERKVAQKPEDRKSTNGGISRNGEHGLVVRKGNLKEEHLGAAKRMFAHALGLHSAKDGIISKCREAKQIDTE
ncbi:hypothetical protein L1049_019737 [Liquidambar formosana]|uniref:R3H domain-containing protein n=1 Tax=Liquidambar formosana TaxID=63359 RepID=A0AAP0X6R5_LIQFO